MYTIKTEYRGELRTSASHLKSGNLIITDAPIDNKGKGEAFSPTDLVCSALSSCMMTIMGIAANRENIDLKGLTAEVTKIMGSNPRKINEIKIKFFHPALKATAKQKESLRRSAITCPVALSLSKDLLQTIEFNF